MVVESVLQGCSSHAFVPYEIEPGPVRRRQLLCAGKETGREGAAE